MMALMRLEEEIDFRLAFQKPEQEGHEVMKGMKGSEGIVASSRPDQRATDGEGSRIRGRCTDLESGSFFNHWQWQLPSFMPFMTSCPSCSSFSGTVPAVGVVFLA
jgi:hypothetical protein